MFDNGHKSSIISTGRESSPPCHACGLNTKVLVMKKLLATFAFFAMIFFAAASPAMATCQIGNECGPNNPHTRPVHVDSYTVRAIVPCFDGTRFYIIASNGRQWHDSQRRWDWDRIHVGSTFHLENAHYDKSGVLHGDVIWNY